MADEEGPAARPQVMPVFMGAPWAQRFGGPGSELNLYEWKTRTEYLAGLQGLSEPQKLQFVLGSLEGEAKREVQAAPGAVRATAKTIYDFLTELYGDTTPVAVLRAQFFNFRQGPRQDLRAYSLRLRELYTRLKERADHGLGEENTLLRDQFLLGLRDGPIRQSLRLQLRQDPTLAFEALRREALAQEADRAETPDPPACMAASGICPPTVVDWKQELRAELMKDVKEQMAELSKALIGELRRGRPSGVPLLRERSYSEGSREMGHRPGRPGPARFQWDDQGRPICNHCGEAGHMSRQCGARRGSQGGF